MPVSKLALGALGLGALLGSAGAARAEPLPRTAQLAPIEWTPDDEVPREPHHWRSFWQMGGGLAVGSIGYWIMMDRNVVDWDNPRPLSRFDGSAWVFDNNSLAVNFLGHPLWGGLSYSFARANHQSVLGAFGYAFLTSFVWEFVLEFKEKISVNDVIVTPGAAVPIGEFFYKLGLYLDTGAGSSVALDVARWLLGSGVAVDRALDGRPAPRVSRRDNLGFTRAIWHEFSLRYGVATVTTPRQSPYARYGAGVSARLVTLPGYLAPRHLSRSFFAAEISDFSVAVEASSHGAGLEVDGDTVLAGYHHQRIRREAAASRGQAVTFGSSVGYDFLRSLANRYSAVERAVALPEPPVKHHEPTRREQYAALHLPGLAADFRLFEPWGGLSLRGRLQPSFGGLGAAAFYSWTAANLDQKGKHVLHRQGYFYGWGGAASLKARLALGPLRGGFDLTYAAYESQDGLDRHPERVTVDVHAGGDVLMYEGSFGVALPATALSVSLDVGVRRFRSRVGGFEVTARGVTRGLSANWTF
jgi:hypothetical protein